MGGDRPRVLLAVFSISTGQPVLTGDVAREAAALNTRGASRRQARAVVAVTALLPAHSHRCRRFADCLVCGHEAAAEALLVWARERWQDANPPQQTCVMVLASSQRGWVA